MAEFREHVYRAACHIGGPADKSLKGNTADGNGRRLLSMRYAPSSRSSPMCKMPSGVGGALQMTDDSYGEVERAERYPQPMAQTILSQPWRNVFSNASETQL